MAITNLDIEGEEITNTTSGAITLDDNHFGLVLAINQLTKAVEKIARR